MLKLEKTHRIIGASVLLILLFLVFALSRGLFSRHDAQHQAYIPLQAKSVMKINSESFIRTFFSEIVLNPEGNVNFDELLDNPQQQRDYGIEFRSDFYLFTLDHEGKTVMGMLCHVLDEKQFTQSLKTSASKSTGFLVKNEVGLIVFYPEETGGTRSDLNQLAKKILEKPSGFDLKKLGDPTSTDDAKISFWSKGVESSDGSISLKDLNMTLTIASNVFELKGNAKYQSTLPLQYRTLKKNDLSIQTGIVPDALNALWVKQTAAMGLQLPKITSVSGNYHYAEPSGVPQPQILPHFDGIYSFEDTVNVYLPLLALSFNETISNLTTTSFQLGEKTLYFTQIDPKTIYLGQTEYGGSTIDKTTIFEVSGSLKHLLEIRNGGMMTRILAMSDQYSALEEFVDGIQDSQFSIRKKGGDEVEISGKIEFKNGKSAMSELIGFLIRL